MNLTVSIESAEYSFRQILEDFFVSVYDEQALPSHGLTHHRRVWGYAREILPILINNESLPAGCDPERLIIACYMHDIGMSAEPGPKHGKKSSEFCQKFLVSIGLDLNAYKDLLEAIENHDEKDYPSRDNVKCLLTILSLADDLDAFGFTGIYRYCEIYLRRGISPYELGDLVRKNARVRFDNFSRTLSQDRVYVSRHRKRYEILERFFRTYSLQAVAYNFETPIPTGHCGVVQLIMLMNRREFSMTDFFTEAGSYRNDDIIAWYLKGIQTELSDYRSYEG
jgi:HD superfamily phosphodiesterase